MTFSAHTFCCIFRLGCISFRFYRFHHVLISQDVALLYCHTFKHTHTQKKKIPQKIKVLSHLPFFVVVFYDTFETLYAYISLPPPPQSLPVRKIFLSRHLLFIMYKGLERKKNEKKVGRYRRAEKCLKTELGIKCFFVDGGGGFEEIRFVFLLHSIFQCTPTRAPDSTLSNGQWFIILCMCR